MVFEQEAIYIGMTLGAILLIRKKYPKYWNLIFPSKTMKYQKERLKIENEIKELDELKLLIDKKKELETKRKEVEQK